MRAGRVQRLDYLAAARAADGGTLIAHRPTVRRIAVDTSQLSGEGGRGWWYDPRTGEVAEAREFPTRGCQDLTPPGDGDWVLVLDDVARDLAGPGSR